MLKQKTLKSLKDGQIFKLSKRSKVTYELIAKSRGQATYTSKNSNLSFTRSNSTVCYVG